ncbi:MAG: MBL fold metallo-hydrolase [Desulfobacterales bacterium]|nr:MBL fold metallo-hydrolase [Desulfobacterales bacterium]
MNSQFSILRRVSGPYYLNTYFLTCKETGDTLIIDPGDQTHTLLNYVRLHRLNPVMVVSTHGHADPGFSMADFQEHYPVPHAIHGDDDAFFQDPDVQKRTRLAVGLPPPPEADCLLVHGEALHFGRAEVSIIHTPGHTPGSVCLGGGGYLFTGDTLFVGEAGRTDLPGGDLDQLVASIRDHILKLPPETILMPGHHHLNTPAQSTLAREMEENIYITDFILDP